MRTCSGSGMCAEVGILSKLAFAISAFCMSNDTWSVLSAEPVDSDDGAGDGSGGGGEPGRSGVGSEEAVLS